MKAKLMVATIAVSLASVVALSTHAASDFLLEIDGVKGESKMTAGTARPQATNRALARPVGGATSGGIRVAAGDVNGDGKTAPAQIPARALAPAQKPSSGLLLPAVQKVREAAN